MQSQAVSPGRAEKGSGLKLWRATARQRQESSQDGLDSA